MNSSLVARSSLVLALAFAGNAFAQAQDSGQQRCLNKSSGSARKVASATIKNAADCLKGGATGDLPPGVTAQDCLSADLRGKVGKARSKVSGQATKFCGAAATPDFGFTDATTINDSHEGEGVSFVPDCFGADLDAALAGPLAADERAKCTSGVIGQTSKVADAMLKVFLDCMKTGLKNSTIVDAAGLDACMDAISLDSRGRVAKAVGRIESKLAASSCTASPGDFFPELDGPNELCDRYGHALPLNSATLATCMGDRMGCRVCRMLNGSHGLGRNCDLFDNGAIDATCPECQNGLTDPGEECDDGNPVDGDGCTSECILEFCGDGVINDAGTEECDDAEANNDATPNACRTDCTLPVCGDLVVDDGFGEACDEGGVASATCDADCTLPECGDGVTNPEFGEECDDGNDSDDDACVGECMNAECGDGFTQTGVEDCDGGECCTGLCEFSVAGTVCTGAVSNCVTPQCNGAGACSGAPANEGASCDDENICTTESVCQAGICTADEYSGVGLACEWVVVGAPTNRTQIISNNEMVSVGGHWCGRDGDFFSSSVFSGDIVTTQFDQLTFRGIRFGPLVSVNGGDIVTNNRSVVSDISGSYALPGVAVSSVAAGQLVNKSPAPTFYDTTGTDPRVAKCDAAQASIATVKTALDALPATANLGSAYQNLPTGAAAPINAVNVGGLNVFDMTHINGTSAGTTITINGGGNANTVVVLRVSTRMNTDANWTFDLTGGLTPDHFLIYVSRNGGDDHCWIGLNNIGAGTLFCPEVKLNVNAGTQWSGAAYGGASGTIGQVRIGEDVVFTYAPFTAALP
ncbi:MAG: hypothetical protein ABR587_00290 [Candidatus Binatia bacterium]